MSNEGEQFDVCKGAGTFSKNSLENAALNIANTISETRKSIINAAPSLKIPPVKIVVLPSITIQKIYTNGPATEASQRNSSSDKVSQTRKMYLTDNASWSNINSTITFLPQSEEFIKASGIETPFWELPMVAAHEFGHHVFDKFFPLKTEQNEKPELNLPGCFHSEMQEKLLARFTKRMVNEDRKRESGGAFAYSSLHEGIGDLISFYALSKGEGSLAGINCMEKSRDVDSDHFGDGTKKRMNFNAVSIMNSTSYLNKEDNDCRSPYFQGQHSVGAIFAYNFNKIVSKYTSNRNSKLELLIKWGQESSTHQKELNKMTTSLYLAEVTKVLYKVLHKNFGESKLNQDCNDIKQMYYELSMDFGSSQHMQCE